MAVVGDGGLTGSLGGKFEVKLEGGDGKCGLGFGGVLGAGSGLGIPISLMGTPGDLCPRSRK